MSERPFELEVGGRVLHGRLHLPERDGPRPGVVICHGFKGFMDWGFFPHLAELLAARGFAVIRFNFSGAGMRPGDELVTDLEAFRGAKLTQDLAELLAVLSTAPETIAPGRIDAERLGLFGHSRGGGTAILAAAHPEWRDRIRALVTWSAVAAFDRLGSGDKQDWRQRGFVTVVNSRTGQELAVGLEVLEDIEEHSAELDLLAAAGRRSAPWLIVHGERDETVPVGEARRLDAAAAPPRELLVIPEADHTFRVKHPFPGPSPELVTALNATQRWFRRHLAGG